MIADKPIDVRVAVLETQVDRIVSDLESEKGTRARVNIEINDKLDKIDDRGRKTERIIWMGLGGLGVLQFVIPVLFKQ